MDSSFCDESVVSLSPDELMIISDNGREKSDDINNRRFLNIQSQQRSSLFEMSSSAGPSSEFVSLHLASSSHMPVATSASSPSLCDIEEGEDNNAFGAPPHFVPSSPSFRDCSLNW
jgi:hypothetical protein